MRAAGATDIDTPCKWLSTMAQMSVLSGPVITRSRRPQRARLWKLDLELHFISSLQTMAMTTRTEAWLRIT